MIDHMLPKDLDDIYGPGAEDSESKAINESAKDAMTELIEKQIEEAAKALEYADYQIGKMQEREKATPEEKTLGWLSAYCERLLQVVQNQQAQIESQREIIRTIEADVCELIKRVTDLEPQTAMGMLNEIVKRGQAGEFYKGEKKR